MLRWMIAIASLTAGTSFALGQYTLGFSFDATAPQGRVTADIFADLGANRRLDRRREFARSP